MRILLLAAGVAGMALTAPAFAFWDDQGRGNGQENRGGGGGNDRGRGNGGGGGDDRGGRGGDENRGRGGGKEERDRGRDVERAREFSQRQQERARDQEQRFRERDRDAAERGRNREEPSLERAERRQERNFEREDRRAERSERRQERAERRTNRRPARVEDPRDLARLNWDQERGVGRGCPPGLAKKNNGCMPPGQAKQMADTQNWYSGWWSNPQSQSYMYDGGYLVRLNNGGSIEQYIPLLGGALWPGQTWPDQYQAASVDDYHLDYFGLQDNQDYRFADGAIYGVDPSNNLIQQVVALVAGDDWSVGQQMPEGYGIYNVPYEYRDQYQDTNDAMYRYSDGYVYQVDPTTQLIQAVIQLIT